MESQPWPGSLPRGARDLGEQVHAQKGGVVSSHLALFKNQVMNQPHKCRLKLVGVIEAISIAGVLLSSIEMAAVGLAAFASSKPEPRGLLFVSWGKLSVYVSS